MSRNRPDLYEVAKLVDQSPARDHRSVLAGVLAPNHGLSQVTAIREFADDPSGFRPETSTPAAVAVQNTVRRDLVCRQNEVTGPVAPKPALDD